MPSTPQQLRRRDQVEAVLRFAAPVLDLVLAAGDRVSRIVAPAEDDHYAIQPGERLAIDPARPRAPRSRPTQRSEA